MGTDVVKMSQEEESNEDLRALLQHHGQHCRHLETQRTTFLLAYIGSVASILGFIYFRTNIEWTIVIPILLTILALALTIRWGNAFEEHRKRIGMIVSKLDTKGITEDLSLNIRAGRFFSVFRTRVLFYSFCIVLLIGLIIMPFLHNSGTG